MTQPTNNSAAKVGGLIVLGVVGLAVLGGVMGSCGGSSTSSGGGSSSGGSSPYYGPQPELDMEGGGPIVPAPAPNLNPNYGEGYVPDPYGGSACTADITTC